LTQVSPAKTSFFPIIPTLVLIADIDNTDVMSDEWSADINVVSGALKLWFRELPEPLLTYGLYNAFIEAARESPPRSLFVVAHAKRKATRMIDFVIYGFMNRSTSFRIPTTPH
jgi:hypothetical protein